ncbi:MAG: hypothetical protein WCT19_01980 [Candidatus Paceibacterota bacterium]|jgi:hypothetical protein
MEKIENNLEKGVETDIQREKTKPTAFYEKLEKARKSNESDSERIAGIRAALNIIEANPQTSLRQSYKDGLEKGYSLEELETLKKEIPDEKLLEEAVKEKMLAEQNSAGQNEPNHESFGKKIKKAVHNVAAMLGIAF